MTPWLLPENRAALKAVWTTFRLRDYFGIEGFIASSEEDDSMGNDFESDLNMAALAWLHQHSEHASLTILLEGDKIVTEQLIEAVNRWLEEEAQ